MKKTEYISKNGEPGTAPHDNSICPPQPDCRIVTDSAKMLSDRIEKLHTTELGAERIRRNLCLDTDDVVEWCRQKITSGHADISRKGKNWYIRADGCTITVNAYSCTIITAHKEKK